MGTISQHLKDCAFIAVRPGEKKPDAAKKQDWNQNLLSFGAANQAIAKGYNVGIVAEHNNVLIIDCDDVLLTQACDELLPATYSEMTCSAGYHLFFQAPGIKDKQNWNIGINQDGKHLGEIRSSRQMVVVAPSRARSKISGELQNYTIARDLPLAEINKEQLTTLLKRFGSKSNEEGSGAKLSQDVLDKILAEPELAELFNTKLQKGERSEPEIKLIDKLIARNFDKETIFKIMAAAPMATKWRESSLSYRTLTYNKACGYSITQKIESEELEAVKDERIKLFTIDEALQFQTNKDAEIVQDILSEGLITLLAAKRAHFKSVLALALGLSVAGGKDFLQHFKTKKPARVLYLDEENATPQIKERIDWILKALGLENDNVVRENFRICPKNCIRLDDTKSRKLFLQALEDFKPEVVILDSLRRFFSFNENDATEVNRLFDEILKPIIKHYGIAMFMLHHARKGGTDRKDITDQGDEARGSSDFQNAPDITLSLTRQKNDNSIILHQTKNRVGQEFEPKLLEIEWGKHLKVLGDASDPELSGHRYAAVLWNWIITGGIIEFKTADAIAAVKLKDISERNAERGITLLKNTGKIEQVKRGWYKVLLDTKLIVDTNDK